MDSKKAYEIMKEEYVDREALELCNQIEKQLERIISYDDGFLNDRTFDETEKSGKASVGVVFYWIVLCDCFTFVGGFCFWKGFNFKTRLWTFGGYFYGDLFPSFYVLHIQSIVDICPYVEGHTK